MFKWTTSKLGFFLFSFFFSIFFLGTFLYAQPPDSALQQYVLSIDASLLQTSMDPAARPNSLKRADRYYVNLLRKNPVYYSILRSNSKGKVVNEVVRGKRPVRNFRDVSRQKSYRVVSKSRNPYYGFYTTRGGDRFFMWAYPLITSSKKKFAGILIAKMNVDVVLAEFGKSQSNPFRVYMDGDEIYSSKWPDKGRQTAGSVRKKLGVPGPQNLEVEFVPPAAPVDSSALTADSVQPLADTASTKAPLDSTFAVDTSRKAVLSKRADSLSVAGSIPKKELPRELKLEGVEPKKEGSGFPFFALGIGVVVVLALALGILFARQTSRESDSIL